MTQTRRRGRPKGGGQSPAQARRALIDAAERCFARTGIAATTVDDIATEAGVSRSLLYTHVSGRDELLDEVITRMTDRFVDQLSGSLAPDAPLGEHIVELMAQSVELVRADPVLVAMFSADGSSAAGRVVGSSARVHERARSFAERVLDSAGPDRVADLRPGLEVSEGVEHLVLVGLALIQGFDHLSDDPQRLRAYLRDFAVPPLLAAPRRR